MYSERRLYCLHCLAISDFHLPCCQPATVLQDFSAVRHRQLPNALSGVISKLCHFHRSDFFQMMYEYSSQQSPSAELGETCLVASITCEKCPFIITLSLLFLSC